MNLTEIDRWCDRFEQRLRGGDRLTVEEFLASESLSAEVELVRELRKVADELAAEAPGNVDASSSTSPRVGATPRHTTAELVANTTLANRPLREFGPYRVIRTLGEGGMGVVYEAEQVEPVRRRVALKIIKPGMDSRQLIARFEVERQALSLMDHPHIARVLDAGCTDEGRSFFVMELVEGVSVTKFCDSELLGLHDRLELFVAICIAVQHAHQKGVIHRDLKPSNILVARLDGKPRPKIIDFGLAKALEGALTDSSQLTQLGQILGTIDYMSPEQASFRNVDVDTRSDIYSLGALLYELLTGETPFGKERLRQESFEELLRIVRSDDPPRPSERFANSEYLSLVASRRKTDARKLRQLVRGELDWIVMRALEKDRARRYETAIALAQDVQRYLDNEAVSACPPSISYRLRKLVSRHRGLFTASLLVLLTIVLGLFGTAWQAVRATWAETDLTVQRDRALSNERLANANLDRAIVAEQQSRQSLRQSLLDESRARRWSRRQGQRFASLEALRKAAEIEPGLDVRNEVIASLALTDLRIARQWPGLPPDVRGLFFDQDLKRYAHCDSKGIVHIRRAGDGRELNRLPHPLPGCEDLLFSPDERHFVTIVPGDRAGYNELHLWKLPPEGEATLVLATLVLNRAVDFRPDGVAMAVAKSDRSIRIYRVEDGVELRKIGTEFPLALSYHPEGRVLAVCDRSLQRVDVCNAETGAVINRFSFESTHMLHAIAWHPRGETLAMAWGHRVALGSTTTGAISRWLDGHPHSVVDNLAYSRAGDLLATDSWDGRVCFWDGHGESLLLSALDIHQSGWGPRFRFGPSDQTLAYQLHNGNVQLWEVAHRQEFVRLTGEGTHHVAFHPHGRLAVVLDETRLRIWDLTLHALAADVPLAGYWSPVFHPRGDHLMVASESGLHVIPFSHLDAEQPHHISVGPARILWRSPFIHEATISPDGAKVAVLRTVGPNLILDWNQPEKQVVLEGHKNAQSIEFSADGRRLATSTWKGQGVWISDPLTGQVARKLSGVDGSARVAFSADGRWLGTSEPTGYQIWDADGERVLKTMSGQGTEIPGAMAFAPNGEFVALSAGQGDVRLVELPGGRELATLSAPQASLVEYLSFTPDGKQIAVSMAGAVQFWDLVAVRRQLAHLKLDWDAPAYSTKTSPESLAALRLDMQLNPEPEPVTRLTRTAPAPVDEKEMSRRLAQLTSHPLLFASVRTGNFDIHLLDPGRGVYTNLTNHPAADSGPSWSPNGKQIAFESTRSGNYDIFVMNVDGSEVKQLTEFAGEDRMPVWSPDGRQLCFRRKVKEREDNWDLMVINADGTEARNITNHPANDTDPSWSSTGLLAFGSTRVDGRWTVFTGKADGSDPRQIRVLTTAWFPHPSWSPDGSRLAFTGIFYRSYQIIAMDANGRNERPLTNLHGLSILASWSPDGRHIAFVHRANGFPENTASLYVMNADGTELTEVGPAETGINSGRPAWKPLVEPLVAP